LADGIRKETATETEAYKDSMLLVLRRRVQGWIAGAFAPLVNWLAVRGVKPNQVSWGGFILAVLAAVLAGLGLFLIAGLLYFFSGVADLIDGALARRAGRESRFGAFLDSILDRAGEGLIHVAAAVTFARWGLWAGVLAVCLSLSGSYLTSYARARADGLGEAIHEAWFSRGERVVLLGAGLVFHFALIAFWAIAVMSWATALQRTWIVHRRLAVPPPGPEHAKPGKRNP